MKIGISGTGGIGKTTLVNAIATHFDIPVISENMHGIIEIVAKIAQASKVDANQKSNAQQIQSDREQRITQLKLDYQNACMDWLNQRAIAQQQANFVADRFAIDLLARLVMPTSQKPPEALVLKAVAECRRQANMLDLIIMPPLMPLAATAALNEAGLKRHDALSMKLFSHSLNRGLIEQLVKVPRVYLPASAKTTQERLAIIDRALVKLKVQKKLIS